MSDESALTRAQAALELGVSTARISQLLTKGDLAGPAKSARNGPRVSRVSLDEYVKDHPVRGKRRRVRPGEDSGLARRVSELEALARDSERPARLAVLAMKVELDNMRELLAASEAERAKSKGISKELTKVLLDLDIELSNLSAGVAGDQSLLRGYGEALTQLLAPDSPAGL